MEQVTLNNPSVSTAPINSNQPNYAGFYRRGAALAVDGLIIGCITLLLRVVLGKIIPTAIASNISYLISFLYYVILWVQTNGQTPGKKLVKIRIVREDGRPIDWVTAGLRQIFTLVSSYVFLLGYIWAYRDKKKQTWHDKIAKTIVVEDGGPATTSMYLLGYLVVPIISIVVYIPLSVALAAYMTPVSTSPLSLSYLFDIFQKWVKTNTH
ncbi:MAG: RDD family protein [candidate division WWE3 bacterium]|nr:RDD family protein [candidate division WWE3 bacterium]